MNWTNHLDLLHSRVLKNFRKTLIHLLSENGNKMDKKKLIRTLEDSYSPDLVKYGLKTYSEENLIIVKSIDVEIVWTKKTSI